MNAWRYSRLGEFCETGTGGTPPRDQSSRYYEAGTIPWVKSGELRENTIEKTSEYVTEAALRETNLRLVPPGAVLLAMYGATVGRLGMLSVPATTNQAICHIVPHPTLADARYVFHALYAQVPRIVGRGVGGAQPNINQQIVRDLPIALPSLPEQRRIAEVLDRAAALRAKRRAALALLDTLTQSIFLEMFGETGRNDRKWPTRRLAEVLGAPLRNGLSPSNGGAVVGRVLTLSAVTGERFDETAVKVSQFATAPVPNYAVDEHDFLVCRGNGNPRLVGKGYFPIQAMFDVAFPDTIIAARVSPQQVVPSFLEIVWKSRGVRRQIEAGARTTNGTFKINQTLLEGVTFVCPPLPLQTEFSVRVHAVRKLEAAHRASLAKLDELFASLQHRAFRGEL